MIDIEVLKQACRVTSDLENDYIMGLEQNAVDAVSDYEGADYAEPGSRTKIIKGSGTSVIWLPSAPSDATVSVVEHIVGGTPNMLETTDHSLLGRRLIRKFGVWYSSLFYEITYNGGVVPGSEPGRVRQAVIMLVALWYNKRVPLADVKFAAQEIPYGITAMLRRRVRV